MQATRRPTNLFSWVMFRPNLVRSIVATVFQRAQRNVNITTLFSTLAIASDLSNCFAFKYSVTKETGKASGILSTV